MSNEEILDTIRSINDESLRRVLFEMFKEIVEEESVLESY